MKIVVLDGGTLNPGDLSWEGFKAFGELEIYDVTPKDKVVERSKDADILIINKIVLATAAVEIYRCIGNWL